MARLAEPSALVVADPEGSVIERAKDAPTVKISGTAEHYGLRLVRAAHAVLHRVGVSPVQ